MNRFSVTVYVGGSFFFENETTFTITTKETLEQLVKRLASEGFQDQESKEWLMPGAIMKIQALPPKEPQ